MGMISTWQTEERDETLVESAWEREMQMLGAEHYEVARNGKSASGTSAGKKFIREKILILSEAIEQFQKDLVGRPRVQLTSKGTVIIVPADTLALLAIRPLIDSAYSSTEPETGSSYKVISREIGKSVEIELNFRNWVSESKEAAKLYAKDQGFDKTPKSLAERLIAEQGLSRMSLHRWSKAFDELNRFKWSELEEYYCGDALLNTCVKALPDCFEVHWPWRKGQKRKYVRMTSEFRDSFDNVEAKSSRIQTFKKPMITKPKRWEQT